jgi:hypothetical protein
MMPPEPVPMRYFNLQVFDANGRLVWSGAMPESDLHAVPDSGVEGAFYLTFAVGTKLQIVEDEVVEDES